VGGSVGTAGGGASSSSLLLLRPFRTVTRPVLWADDASALNKTDACRREVRNFFKLTLVRDALQHFTSTRSLRAVEEALQQLNYDRVSRGLIVGFLRKHFAVDTAATAEPGERRPSGGGGVPSGGARTSPSRTSPARAAAVAAQPPSPRLIDKKTGTVLNATTSGGDAKGSSSSSAPAGLLCQFPRTALPPFAIPRPGAAPKCVTSFVDYVFGEALVYTVAPRLVALASSATPRSPSAAGFLGSSQNSSLADPDAASSVAAAISEDGLAGALQQVAAAASVQTYLCATYGMSQVQVGWVWPMLEGAVAQILMQP
jgi:hypothetical protein